MGVRAVSEQTSTKTARHRSLVSRAADLCSWRRGGRSLRAVEAAPVVGAWESHKTKEKCILSLLFTFWRWWHRPGRVAEAGTAV